MNHDEIAKNLSDNIDSALFERYGAEWKRRAEQAEADRKVLAEEVEAWRKWKSEYHAAALSWTTAELAETRSATDASGALNRVKVTERCERNSSV